MVLEQTNLDITVGIQENRSDFGGKMVNVMRSGPKIGPNLTENCL